jgi:Domain of unknown function (DUF3458_C) ARM repeats
MGLPICSFVTLVSDSREQSCMSPVLFATHKFGACSCYSLFLGFARSPVNFHAANGSGYKFMGDAILKV